MKKRAVSVMLTAAMVSAMLAGCGSKNAETQSAADTTAESAVSGDETSADTQAADAETTDASKTDGTFTVGFDQDFPPMGFVGDDGEFTGFDLEMAAEVAKRLNLTIAYQPIAWDAKDMELDAGTIDCIWNGFTMNGREDDYEWSKPYMKNNQVFVVRGDSDINSEADLAGKNVEVQTDSSAEAALNDNSELTSTFGSLTPVADYNTAFMDLESGAVDAIAMDDVVASYQITSRKADFKVLDDVIAAEEYGIGFKKGIKFRQHWKRWRQTERLQRFPRSGSEKTSQRFSKSDREQKAGCCICGSPFYADNEPKCISHGFTQRKEKLLWVSARCL